MPELPEVEHVVRALRRVIVKRTIVASEIRLPKLIAPLSAWQFNRKVKNATIRGVSRRGKFILIELAPDAGAATSRPTKRARPTQQFIIAVHLRMTGKFVLLNSDDELPKHAHAILYLDREQRLVFRDQRQFGVMKLI